MRQDRDAVAEQLRDRIPENLTENDFLQAIAAGFVANATDDADPIEHPAHFNDATPDQQHAIRHMMSAFLDYVVSARIDDHAVDAWVDAFNDGDFIEWEAA